MEAPHNRIAFVAMVSNTGWASVCAPAMTRSTSAVAVCCSRDTVRSRLRASSSWNRRTFSIAMAPWSANVVISSICLSVKGATCVRQTENTPMGTPSRSIGTPRIVRYPPSAMPPYV